MSESNFPIDFKEIKKFAIKDALLSKILLYARNGWPSTCSSVELKPFFIRKNEITIDQDCLMWGYRLIIPHKFRQEILDELNSLHMGIVKIKSMARAYVWWPNLEEQIEQISQTCAVFANNPPKTFLSTWDWPKEPWTRLHADFFGPIFNKNFLVIEDATSKWIECFEVNNITTNNTIKVLRELFARFGLPVKICTDNAKAFTSSEFQNFLKQLRIWLINFLLSAITANPNGNQPLEV